MCNKCKGVHKLVVGALLLLNAFVWPQWNGIDGWVAWFGVLMVVGGFLKLVVPACCKNSCTPDMKSVAKPAAKKVAKKRKR